MIGCTSEAGTIHLTISSFGKENDESSPSFNVFGALILSSCVFAQDSDDQKETLAKANQNPVANMIMVPIEFWHHEGANGDGFTAVAKPTFGPDWSVLFGVKFLIPTGEMRASMQQ